jgi:hypothetical protein
MRLILIVIFLSGCSSVVTRDNALEDCPQFYNVRCLKLNNEPDYPIEYIGREVGEKCNRPVLGCIVNKTIYQWQKDWLVTAHERCHNYCGRFHNPPKRIIKNPYLNNAKILSKQKTRF